MGRVHYPMGRPDPFPSILVAYRSIDVIFMLALERPCSQEGDCACERTEGPVASSGSGRAAHRGSNPIGIQPGVAPGKFPRGVPGCECV